MEILRVSPSLLRGIAEAFNNNAKEAFEAGSTKPELVTAFKSDSGLDILLVWEPIFNTDGTLENP